MNKTFEEIKAKVLDLIENDTYSAVNDYMQGFWSYDDIVREVYSDCKGDGNAMTNTWRVGEVSNPNHFFVTVEGTYSSWDGNDYDAAYISEPVIFTEIRYQKKKEGK